MYTSIILVFKKKKNKKKHHPWWPLCKLSFPILSINLVMHTYMHNIINNIDNNYIIIIFLLILSWSFQWSGKKKYIKSFWSFNFKIIRCDMRRMLNKSLNNIQWKNEHIFLCVFVLCSYLFLPFLYKWAIVLMQNFSQTGDTVNISISSNMT